MAYIRWTDQILFSINLALLIVWVNAQTSSSIFVGRVGYPVHRYLSPYWEHQWRMALRPGGYVEFIGLWWLLAAVVLLLLQLLTRISLPRVLRLALGAVVGGIFGFPLACLYLRTTLGFSAIETLWLSLEAVAFAFCAVLYLYRKWPVPDSPTVVLLALHFVLWGWTISHETRLWVVFPVVGFCSCLVGGFCLKQPEVADGP